MTIEAELLDESQASEVLTLKIRTLQNWRTLGQGPAYIKLGTGIRAAVRYKRSELARFISAGEVTSTSAHSVRSAA